METKRQNDVIAVSIAVVEKIKTFKDANLSDTRGESKHYRWSNNMGW